MFNIGPAELLVLGIVAVLVIGPDKLPALARDAARLLRSLRELATGAQHQLRDELGPEFADIDLSELRALRNLNPRTALQRAILGDTSTGLRSELRDLDPRALTREVFAEEDKPLSAPPQRPLAPGEAAPYDADAT